MTKKDSPISGRHRIVEMPDFDPEYVDEETEAFTYLLAVASAPHHSIADSSSRRSTTAIREA